MSAALSDTICPAKLLDASFNVEGTATRTMRSINGKPFEATRRQLTMKCRSADICLILSSAPRAVTAKQYSWTHISVSLALAKVNKAQTT